MSNLNSRTSTVTADQAYDNFWNHLGQNEFKEAQVDGTSFIRTKVRQEAICRAILDGSRKLEESDLDRSVHTDQPRRIEEIEVDSVASYVPFNGTSRRRVFRGDRFEIYFGKIESQRNRKNRYNLMTYRSDIRKQLTDNAIYDMADVEDQMFFDECKQLLSLPSAAGQTLSLSGGLTSQNVVSGLQRLAQLKVPFGTMVMSQSMHLEALNLPATSVGDSVASEHYKQGIGGQKHLWGHPVITTIKNDIVADNEIWFFAPQNYLGYHYHLDDATLYIKEEADMIEFYTYSAIGIGIAGSRGIVRAIL